MQRIYLDNNATTKPDPEAVTAVREAMEKVWGNPSSLHYFGQEARRLLDRARTQAAGLTGALPEEIIFTGSGTEANNLALFGAAMSSTGSRRRIITTTIEHQSVINTCRRFSTMGFEVVHIHVGRDGVADLESARELINGETAVVSVMAANNDTGVLQPVAEIASLARERGAIFHTDAVQAAGKMPIDAEGLGVDLLTFSSHKIYGPKGAGALFVKRGTLLSPIILGGHQERMLRAGTEAIPAIAGFGKACELAAERIGRYGTDVKTVRDAFELELISAVPDSVIHGDPSSRLPNTSNIGFKGIDAESLAMNLDLMGIAVSTGAACAAGDKEPSHVLLAMGRSREEARESLRISFGLESTIEEAHRAALAVSETISWMRQQKGQI
jgi:cysteine desulfurase